MAETDITVKFLQIDGVLAEEGPYGGDTTILREALEQVVLDNRHMVLLTDSRTGRAAGKITNLYLSRISGTDRLALNAVATLPEGTLSPQVLDLSLCFAPRWRLDRVQESSDGSRQVKRLTLSDVSLAPCLNDDLPPVRFLIQPEKPSPEAHS